MDEHIEEKTILKTAYIDRGIKPVVKWLNDLYSVNTEHCCEGDEQEDIGKRKGEEDEEGRISVGQKPYVTFTCNDVDMLTYILQTISGYGECKIDIVDREYFPYFKYCINFYTKDHLRIMVRRIKNDTVEMGPTMDDLEQELNKREK